MKIILTYILFLIVVLTFSFCTKVEKNVMDYYPSVKTVSAIVLQDGSVEVKGEIISDGTTPIKYAGFCLDTIGMPGMLNFQALAPVIQGNTFSVVYSGFDRYTRYYFRSWAANGFGYSYGNVIYLDSIKATPLIPPCSPGMNTINIGGGNPTQSYYSVGIPTLGASTWDFQAQSSSNTINFKFGSSPVTRIYTTTTSTSPSSNEVNVSFYSGFISGTLSNGSSIYVNQTGPASWEMTICNAPWIYNGGSTFTLITKFTCPL